MAGRSSLSAGRNLNQICMCGWLASLYQSATEIVTGQKKHCSKGEEYQILLKKEEKLTLHKSCQVGQDKVSLRAKTAYHTVFKLF